MNKETVILLRVTRVGPRERELADELANFSSYPVAYLVDGRSGCIEPENRPMVTITDDKVRSLGLHLTDDYAWRCGDYGLYLALRQFPSAAYFWIIEGDVRITGKNPSSLFRAMESTNADFIAGHLEAATWSYFWRTHAQGKGTKPMRCLFSAVRVSTRLTIILEAKRKFHSQSLWRKALWPNDEVFVATTALFENCKIADINDINGPWYSSEMYEYNVTLDGSNLPVSDAVQLLHSVKWLAKGEQRVLNPRSSDDRKTLKKMLASRILAYLPW